MLAHIVVVQGLLGVLTTAHLFSTVSTSTVMGFSQNEGSISGGPLKKGYSILGVYIGVPFFAETSKSL